MSSSCLGKKSMAPALNASSVALLPTRVIAENMIIGVGVSAIICLTAAIPSITGISTSIVITSGANVAASITASWPLCAKPTTRKSASSSKILLMDLQIKCESSTINTLMVIIQCPISLHTSSSNPAHPKSAQFFRRR
jgi:hypothetical protein